MDADTARNDGSILMRMTEQAVRTFAMALVLTGQMLPAGAVSAQDGQPSPALSAPAPQDVAQQPPEAQALPATPAVVAPEPTPIESKPAAPAEDEKREVVIAPQATAAISGPRENTYTFGDWTVTIRHGEASPRSAPCQPAALFEAPVPPPSISVPVTVHIQNSSPPQPTLWLPPWSYSSNPWSTPTSAYLFQRPRPYWQLDPEFHRLRPFIRGLWY